MHNLTYRPLSPADAVALHKIVSHWSVVRQLGGWPWPASRAFTFGRCVPYARSDGFVWAVCRDGELCGSVAVTGGQIGYMLDPDVCGQGIMTQAAADAIDAYFMTDATRLDANVWHDNPASQQVLEKLGFVHWSTRYEHAKARRLPTLSHHLTLTRDAWHGLRTAAQ
ncbi:MAG: RimJ/RimL family protein N-acetyltransferase [Yoonia sp.]|jgi:RimJ/RimL family protein N-acetyltransferase